MVNAPAQGKSFDRGLDGEHRPLTFTTKGSRCRDNLAEDQAEHFVMLAQWWMAPMPGGKPLEAHMYRMPLIPTGTVELVKQPDGSWRLWKAYDRAQRDPGRESPRPGLFMTCPKICHDSLGQ